MMILCYVIYDVIFFNIWILKYFWSLFLLLMLFKELFGRLKSLCRFPWSSLRIRKAHTSLVILVVSLDICRSLLSRFEIMRHWTPAGCNQTALWECQLRSYCGLKGGRRRCQPEGSHPSETLNWLTGHSLPPSYFLILTPMSPGVSQQSLWGRNVYWLTSVP